MIRAGGGVGTEIDGFDAQSIAVLHDDSTEGPQRLDHQQSVAAAQPAAQIRGGFGQGSQNEIAVGQRF